MGTLEDLLEEKSKILSKISFAASEGKTDLILLESARLERVEHLINQHRHIVSELEELKSDTGSNFLKEKIPEKRNTSRLSTLASSRELGVRVRAMFVSKLEKEGINLQLIKGKSIYRTKSGKRVGIAVATERLPNRWFLGLPADGFDHAVLLCHNENKDLIEFPLSEKFFAKYRNTMSQSNGQMKFNVVRRGDRILLQVPGTEGISRVESATGYSFLL